MPYLCPNCRRPLLPGTWQCAAGHGVEVTDGIVRLLSPALAAQLSAFLPALEDYRHRIGRRLLDPSAYPELPFGAAVRGDREWEQRQYDLAVVRELMERHWPGAGRQTVLDVGAYNGWLSARLSREGHQATAVEIFTDPFDGLGARRHYPTEWEAVQMDVRDLALLDTRYDVVILNRCLAFQQSPVQALRLAQAQVAPGGLLIATGLQVFLDARAKARQVQERDYAFRERYGQPIFLWPTRGLLDKNDLAGLRAAGLHVRPYRQLWWPNVKAWLKPALPRHYYGVWAAPQT